MTHDTVIFYAKKIRQFCEDSDGCRNCPFYSFDNEICQFAVHHQPHVWEIPEDEENGND